LPTSKDLPSSLVQLRIAVWTGATRDTRRHERQIDELRYSAVSIDAGERHDFNQ
jgi:hypothetical protein